MERTDVQKLAQILRILVILVFLCNLIAVYLVPAMVMSNAQDPAAGGQSYLHGILFPAEDDVAAAGVFASFYAWFAVWKETYQGVLALFLVVCGLCTAVILWQAKRVLDMILQEKTFSLDNARSLLRAAVCCFLIAAAALLRLCWGFWYYRSVAPLLTYNALFVPLFFMGGLLCLVMSALFRQAAELKAENDLTI